MSSSIRKSNYSQIERRHKVVEQLHIQTGEVLRVHKNMLSASKFMGLLSSDGISACCRNLQQKSSGFKWRFYEGPPIDCKSTTMF